MSAIHQVVVHRDGAMVTRRGRVPVEAGQVVVSKLPLLLDERSLRAEITGASLVELRLEYDLAGVDRGDSPVAETAWFDAKAALDKATAEYNAVRSVRRGLEDLAPPEPDEVPDDVRPSAAQLTRWRELEARIAPWAEALDARLHDLKQRVDAATDNEAIARYTLERQTTTEVWARWVPARQVVLRVEGDATEVELELSYRVEGATWTPAYALHTDHLFRAATFVVRALVAQATGEDWTGVQLALSTAACARRITLPELPATRIGTRQAPRPSPWRALPEDLDQLFPDDLDANDLDIDWAALAEPDAEPEEELDDLLPIAQPSAMPPPAPAMRSMGMPSDMPAQSQAKSSSIAGAIGGMAEGIADFASQTLTASNAPAPPGGPPPADVPPNLRVGGDLLDYPKLRLADWQQPAGVRGRLQPLDRNDAAVEAGVPPEAAGHLGSAIDRMWERFNAVRNLKLPPHHVVPGPVDHADHRFDAEGTVDLPSDGRWHSVSLLSEPVELEVRYRTVPREDPRCFRLVRAPLTMRVPLLPGPADVYVDGSLLLTTPWQGTAGRTALEMGLGVEDALRVARNVRYQEASAGMFGGSRKLVTEVEVEVASGLARPAKVQICDRVPVAGGDNVVVEVLAKQCEPAPKAWDGDRDGPILKGGKVQSITVPAGGRFVAKLAYAVTLSNKEELVGGDRRG